MAKPKNRVYARTLARYLAILPFKVAKAQTAYEVRQMILRARTIPVTLKTIANQVGVCRERVRMQEWSAHNDHGPPIERYFAEVGDKQKLTTPPKRKRYTE